MKSRLLPLKRVRKGGTNVISLSLTLIFPPLQVLPLVAIKAKKLSEIPVESDEFEVDINSLQSTVKDIVTRLTDLGSTIKESRSVEEEIEEKIIESYASRHSIRPGGVNANRMSRQLRSFPVAGTNNSEEDSSDIDKSELMRQFTAAAQENYLTSSVSPISRQVAASTSQAAALVEEEENDQKLQMSSSNDALVPDILDSYNSSSDDQRQEQRQDDSEVVFPSTSAKQTDAVASPNTLAQKLAKASLQQHNDGGQNEDEEAIDENAEYVEEDAPQLLTAEEAAENPLLAVAQELLVETSSWSSEGNPIVAAAMGLSNQMEKLSKYHIELRFSSAAETKKGFINAAKDIVMHASNIDIPAKQLAEQCTDLRLKRQLLQSIDRIGTIAQQLKIVAAVKAASPKDTDRDQQLIQCAQNLMQAVRTVLRYCEVASIRINKMMQAAIIAQHQVIVGAENSLLKVNTVTSRVSTDSSPRLSVISFRKKIFKGRSRSGTATSSIDDFSLGSASSSAQSTVRRGRSDSNPLQSPSLSRLRSRANTVDQQRFLQQQQKQEEPDMVQFDLGVSAGAAGVSFTVVLATPLEKPDNAVLPTVAPPARRSNTATTTTSHDAAVVEEETRDEVKEPKKSTSAPRQNSIASTSTRTSTSAQSNSYNTVISARTSVAAALPTNIPSSPTVSERKTLLSAHSNQPRTTSQDTSVDSTTTTAAAAVISGSSVVSNSFNFFKQLDAKSKASSAQSTAAAPPPPPGAQSNSK